LLWAKLVLLIGFALTLNLLQPEPGKVEQDTIDLSVEFQTIEHFGASDCWTIEPIGKFWSEQNKQRIADLLFSLDKGIGLSCWRFNIGAGLDDTMPVPYRTVESFAIAEGVYDWSRCAGQRWFLRAAKNRGVPYFLAFVNSPPRFLTKNGHPYCDPEVRTTNLREGAEGAFARYIADIISHFRNNPDESERITFNFVSPVNEPQWEWNGPWQEGNRASNDDIRKIVKALHAELKRRNLPTEIVIPESGDLPHMWSGREKYGGFYGRYIREFCGDTEIAPLLGYRLSYHSYWSDAPYQIVAFRKRLREELGLFPGWRLWQTEYCVMEHNRDLTMATALRVARVIQLDLTIVGVTAWHWWLAVSIWDYKDGLLFTDWKKPGDPENIIVPKLFWAFGNFSKFVRPGMKRVLLSRDNEANVNGLLGSAFRDPESGKVVLVYVNMQNAPVRLLLNWRGDEKRKVDRLTPFVTSENTEDNLRPYPSVPATGPIEIPPRSVVTLVGEPPRDAGS
jgi:O-glycosyl hydrolase